ncbi:MAG: GAF domain-containing protein [Elusimicrobia bacterium]|nr:GAF domain-containing protein [Elusimicrobiota bacterium]
MTFLAFSGLANCLGCLLVAAIVFYSNPKRRLNQSYCVFNLAVALYSFGYFFWQLSAKEETALLWFKLLFTGVILINLVYLDFVFTFTDSRQQHKWLFRTCVVLNAWFLYLNASSNLYTALVPRHGLGYWPLPTKWFHGYLAFWTFQLLYGYFWLWRNYRSQTGRKRGEYKYLLSAFSIGFFGGATNWPMWYDVPLPPYLNILIIVYLGIVAYAIVAKRLFDIGLVARDVVVKGCALALVAVPLLVGRLLAESVRTLSWKGLTFGNIGALTGGVLNFSLAITLLRYHQNPPARLLCRFFLLLGMWESHELLLMMPQTPFSVFLHRASYAIGCWVILSWAEFWKSYGDSNGFASHSIRWFSWLRWTAYGMMGLCLFTPFVQQSLHFDPTMQRSALEVPGSAYPLFALWVLTAIAVSGWWTIRAFLQATKAFSKVGLGWVLGSFSFAGAAAVNYFGYVQGHWTLPLYPLLAMLMSLCLIGTLWHQLNRSAWKVSPQDFSLGVVSFTVPFLAGFLLTGSAWGQVVAGMLLVLFVPRILSEIHESVQTWVDKHVFWDKSGSLRDLQKFAQQAPRVQSMKEYLPELAQEVVRRAQVHSCSVLVYLEDLVSQPRFQTTYGRNGDGQIVPGPEWEGATEGALFQLLKQRRTVVLREEASLPHPGGLGRLDDAMLARLDPTVFAVAVPLIANEWVFGMIVLGAKLDQRAYFHHEDLKWLEALAKTIAEPLWARVEHYAQTMRMETTLHDAINYLKPVELIWTLKGLAPKDLASHYLGINLLTDARMFNLLSMDKQLGRGPTIKAIHLGKLVASICQIQQRVAAAIKGLDLITQVEDPLPPVRGDQRYLDRCLTNLIGNAIKYTAEGTIVVSVRQLNPQEIELCVADTGPGIPPESLSRIFDPFYRVPGKMSLEEGTGLGLAVVKEYITAIHGRVEVQSEVGKGSRFSIYLPVETGGALETPHAA